MRIAVANLGWPTLYPVSLVSNIEATTSDGVILEGKLRLPDATPHGGVVLAHPHPDFGGTMDVWLLPRIAERLAADGWAVLRLNFRGVGRSQGRRSGGELEHLDLEAGVVHLRQVIAPTAPIVAVGWSFGAMIALRLGPTVAGWVGIAPPTREIVEVPLRGPVVPSVLPPHRTVIVGEHDQFFPPSTVDVLRPDAVVVVADTDHFFFDRDPEVAEHVAAALRALPVGTSRHPPASSQRHLGGRYVVRITPADVGSRVSVRARRDPTAAQPEAHTDAVGLLESWEGGMLQIRRRSGELTGLHEGDLVAGKVIPPAPR